MRRPMLLAGAPFLLGILAADLLVLPFWNILPVAWACLGAMFFVKPVRPVLVYAVLFSAGAVNQTFHNDILSPRDLRAIIGDTILLTSVRGVLVETPVHRVSEWGGKSRWRSLVRVAVDSIRKDGEWKPAEGQILATAPMRLPLGFYRGRRVEVTGVLQPPSQAVAWDMFDYRAYLRRQGIHFQFRTDSLRDWSLTDADSPPEIPFSDRFQRWARKTLAAPFPWEDGPLRLLWAMTLGWRTTLNGEVAEPFMRSGTMHVFAISGLHIAIIASILLSALRLLQIPRTACGMILIPLLWFYAAATGWQSSAVRATLMVTLVAAGWTLKRPVDLVNSLAASASLILLWEPGQLFMASFQLSFCVVFTIALLLPSIENIFRQWLQPDPFLPPDLWPYHVRWLLRWGVPAFSVSIAAWLGSMPLVAHYFNLFTPVTPLVNLLIVPLAGLTLVSSAACLLAAEWFGWLSGVFAWSAWFWMWLMIQLSGLASQIPCAFAYVEAPPWWVTAGWFLLLSGVLAKWPSWHLKSATLLALAVLVGSGWVARNLAKDSYFRLTVLPLNSGSALFADVPGNTEDLLVDCGGESDNRFAVVPLLRSRGMDQLPHLLVTHGDTHHVAGHTNLFGQLEVQNTILGQTPFRSPSYRSLAARLESEHLPHSIVSRGNKAAGWQVLHPAQGDQFSRADDGALVLSRVISGVRILLCSDLGEAGQATLLERHPGLTADVVVTGIPGGEEPLVDELLRGLQPRVVIISAGNYPHQERPAEGFLARLTAQGIHVFNTLENGGVELHIHPGGTWRVRAMNGKEWQP